MGLWWEAPTTRMELAPPVFLWKSQIGSIQMGVHSIKNCSTFITSNFADRLANKLATHMTTHKNGKLYISSLSYDRYGYHLNRTSYWKVPNLSLMPRIFADIRNSYPTKIGNSTIKYVRDLTTGYDSSQPNNKAVGANPTFRCMYMNIHLRFFL